MPAGVSRKGTATGRETKGKRYIGASASVVEGRRRHEGATEGCVGCNVSTAAFGGRRGVSSPPPGGGEGEGSSLRRGEKKRALSDSLWTLLKFVRCFRLLFGFVRSHRHRSLRGGDLWSRRAGPMFSNRGSPFSCILGRVKLKMQDQNG